MRIPRKLRPQVEVYEKAGFTIVRLERRYGSHYAVWFEQFTEPQFLTENISCPRSLKNNLARFRRLADKPTEEAPS